MELLHVALIVLLGFGGVVGELRPSSTGPVASDLLTVAGPVDVETDGVHGDSVEDGDGESGVAEVLGPGAELDVGAEGGGGLAVPPVDEVVEGMGGGGLVLALLHLAEAYVVDDEQVGRGPALEPAFVGGVGQAGVEVVQEVDAAGVAHRHPGLAAAQGDGLEDVALAGAALPGEDEVLLATDEVEAGELEDDGLVELGLEGEVEGLERLAFGQAALVDAALDAPLDLVGGLGAEDVIEQRAGAGLLLRGPGEVLVEVLEGVGQPEDFEVLPESFGEIAGAWGSLPSGHGASCAACAVGRRSYSSRSRR